MPHQQLSVTVREGAVGVPTMSADAGDAPVLRTSSYRAAQGQAHPVDGSLVDLEAEGSGPAEGAVSGTRGAVFAERPATHGAGWALPRVLDGRFFCARLSSFFVYSVFPWVRAWHPHANRATLPTRAPARGALCTRRCMRPGACLPVASVL